jgi:hypothetical protein
LVFIDCFIYSQLKHLSKSSIVILFLFLVCASCGGPTSNDEQDILIDPNLTYKSYPPNSTDLIVSRADYFDKLYGFWLGECIANWTGLVTEMDKIGNIGAVKTGAFYTRDDWGQPDLPNIWSGDQPSDLSPTIDFVLRHDGEIWGADDDTDIEYMYQYLLYTNQVSLLTPDQIRTGWMTHMMTEEENYLWVSNQAALDLMVAGVLPPETSTPEMNPHSEMIDAQLTTEIFGFFAPGRPDVALKMASLPIRTTARDNAAWISEFYVTMYSLASVVDQQGSSKEQVLWLAHEARKGLPSDSYSAKMYDFVLQKYNSNIPWEQTRDSIYQRYQVEQADGYDITSKNLDCNGCFAAGINFAASLVSLFYGEGDLKETIKIGALTGWDSDNPTATWGGLLGFMIGKEGVEKAFGSDLSDKFNIHRTRQNFPNDGIDTFSNMAQTGVFVVDRVVQEQLGGGVDLNKNVWYIPNLSSEVTPLK